MGSYDRKIAEGAAPLLDAGETVLASIIARPRGWTQATAGSMVIGQAQVGRQVDAAAGAGFALASPMALAVTNQRLVSLSIGSPIGLGIGGKVKSIAGSAPLSAVDSIELTKLGVGKVVTVTIGGTPFKLEANGAADAKGLVAAFEAARRSLG